MKKNILLAVFCLVLSAMSFAQVPQMMSYQAVVRGSDNNLVVNQQISMRVSILQGSIDGEAVYTETHSATTNANGLLTIEIGDGTSSDDFSAINWANGPFFVKTETDVNGGNDYNVIGVSQLLSVPYAMYAQTAGNVPDVSGFLTEETDPTVPSWAKAETKPAYDYSEINSTPEIPTVPTNVSAFENDANYLTSYTETQSIADAAALGNLVNTQLKNVTDPTENQDAATKKYVDDIITTLQTQNAELQTTIEHLNMIVRTGHDFVDLGLPSGTKWATCNVGATDPEDYGDYFAWGETTIKETYSWSTYKYCNGSATTLTKYCNNSSYGNEGFTDTLTTLEAGDDAATANWGVGWRMPTREEMNELYSNCTYEWTTQNGVSGEKFTGPNGNSIFLPAAGYRNGTEFVSANSIGNGFYWSRMLYIDATLNAVEFHFNNTRTSRGATLRICGLPVRPVVAE